MCEANFCTTLPSFFKFFCFSKQPNPRFYYRKRSSNSGLPQSKIFVISSLRFSPPKSFQIASAPVGQYVWMRTLFLDPLGPLVDPLFALFGVGHGHFAGGKKSCPGRAACVLSKLHVVGVCFRSYSRRFWGHRSAISC